MNLYLILFPALEQDGQTALYLASAAGHTEVVKVLVQAKADTELQVKVHVDIEDWVPSVKATPWDIHVHSHNINS